MHRRSVLLPLDGFPLADHGIPFAAGLAALFSDNVDLLTVVRSLGFEAIDGRLTSSQTDAQRAHLTAVAQRLAKSGIACHTSVEAGDPATVILRHAGAPRCRAVVMATHGNGAVDRAVLGSVADTVWRRSPVPVLVVAADSSQAHVERWRPRRLLVPLDGSELSEAALAPAGEIAARADAEIILASVAPWLTPGVARRVLAGTGVQAAEIDATRTETEYLRDVGARTLAGRRVREAALRGRPEKRLADYALAEGVDLVVMASHGRVGLERFMHGSVADHVVWSGLPVYLVPAGAPLDGHPA